MNLLTASCRPGRHFMTCWGFQNAKTEGFWGAQAGCQPSQGREVVAQEGALRLPYLATQTRDPRGFQARGAMCVDSLSLQLDTCLLGHTNIRSPPKQRFKYLGFFTSTEPAEGFPSMHGPYRPWTC